MKLKSRFAAILLSTFMVAAFSVSAFAGVADFPSYDEETVAKYRALSSEGYGAIEEKDCATAIAPTNFCISSLPTVLFLSYLFA